MREFNYAETEPLEVAVLGEVSAAAVLELAFQLAETALREAGADAEQLEPESIREFVLRMLQHEGDSRQCFYLRPHPELHRAIHGYAMLKAREN